MSKNQAKEKEICFDEIDHFSKQDQAERLADSFSKISQEYDKVKSVDIQTLQFKSSDIPNISVKTVEKLWMSVKTCKATIKDDLPAIIFNRFSKQLSEPITMPINSCIQKGIWPNILKNEIVTAVPKIYPSIKIENLRNKTGLLTLNKITERCIGELMLKDMKKKKLYVSQYANQKGIGIQHYLINMIDRILLALDNCANGEVKAVIATLIDWKQAFPRQCPRHS